MEKITEQKLIEILQAQVKAVTDSDGFSARLKEICQNMINEMKNGIVQPVSEMQGKMMIANLPFSKTANDFIYTEKGSVLNLKNKQNIWVKLSKDVQDWAVDFAKYLKTGNVTKLLSESVDTDGGYLVPEDFRAVMLMYDMESTIVWNRATVWPMSGEKVAMPKLLQNPDVEDTTNFDHFAGVSFAWTEEGGEKSETEPEFGLLELIVHELAGYTEITNTLLDDSVLNLVNYLTRLFRAAWYWQTDKSFIQGPGGKQPLGIINDPNVLLVNRTTAGTIVFEDLLNMESRLPAIYDNGACWFITKKGRAKIRGQKDTAGQLMLQEYYNNLSDGYSMTLLGQPAVLSDGKTPALGSVGDIIYGNWKWYYIGQRSDFAMDSSRHYKFRNNRTALRCSARVDGQAANPQAFVILGDPS